MSHRASQQRIFLLVAYQNGPSARATNQLLFGLFPFVVAPRHTLIFNFNLSGAEFSIFLATTLNILLSEVNMLRYWYGAYGSSYRPSRNFITVQDV